VSLPPPSPNVLVCFHMVGETKKGSSKTATGILTTMRTEDRNEGGKKTVGGGPFYWDPSEHVSI